MKDKAEHGINPDNASHNLDARVDDQGRSPSRDVAEADFAAEAHGFTAFERTGQGSTYRGGALGRRSRPGMSGRHGGLALLWRRLRDLLGRAGGSSGR